MRYLSRRFFKHKVAVSGEDVWVILFCDNLSAHLDEELKKIFGERKVLFCFLPPKITNFLHPIDRGLCRSVRLSVSRHLDEWLMNNDNISRWEGTMPSSERCIPTTPLVGKVMYEVMDTSKEGVDVACFERNGLLTTVISNETNDSKMRPQVMEKGKNIYLNRTCYFFGFG